MKWLILLGLLVSVMLLGGWFMQTGIIITMLRKIFPKISPTEITQINFQKLHSFVEKGYVPKEVYNYTLYYHILHPKDILLLRFFSWDPNHPLIEFYNNSTGNIYTIDSAKFYELVGKNKVRMVVIYSYNDSYLVFTVNASTKATSEPFIIYPLVKEYRGYFNVTPEISKKYYKEKLPFIYDILILPNKEDWDVAEQLAKELKHYQQEYHWSNKTVVDFLIKDLTPIILKYDYHNHLDSSKTFTITAFDGNKLVKVNVSSNSRMKKIIFYGRGVCLHFAYFNTLVLTKMGFKAYDLSVIARDPYDNNKPCRHGIIGVNASELGVKPNFYVYFDKVAFLHFNHEYYYTVKPLKKEKVMGIYVYDIDGSVPTEILADKELVKDYKEYGAGMRQYLSQT